MIDAIDGFCVRKVQVLSQYLEKKTGKNNKFFATLSNTISIMLATPIAILIYSYQELPEKAKYALASFTGAVMLIGFSNFFNFWHKARLERQAKESKNVTEADLTMQLEKHSDNFFRIIGYFFLLKISLLAYFYLPALVGISLVFQMILSILASILVTCEPLVHRHTLRP